MTLFLETFGHILQPEKLQLTIPGADGGPILNLNGNSDSDLSNTKQSFLFASEGLF